MRLSWADIEASAWMGLGVTDSGDIELAGISSNPSTSGPEFPEEVPRAIGRPTARCERILETAGMRAAGVRYSWSKGAVAEH